MNTSEARPPAPPGRIRYRHNPRLAQQELGGKAVVLHFEGRRMLGLNETGTRVWGLLDGTRTLDDVVAEIARASGIPSEDAADDVRRFVAELAERDLVVADDDDSATAPRPREDNRSGQHSEGKR